MCWGLTDTDTRGRASRSYHYAVGVSNGNRERGQTASKMRRVKNENITAHEYGQRIMVTPG
eukprot:2936469-Pleurochrysis_carterae.AAC.3